MLVYPDIQLLVIAYLRQREVGSVSSRVERHVPHVRIQQVGGYGRDPAHSVAMVIYQAYAATEYDASLACRRVEQQLLDLQNTFVDGGVESGHLTHRETVGVPSLLNDPDRPDWWRYQGSMNIGARIINVPQ